MGPIVVSCNYLAAHTLLLLQTSPVIIEREGCSLLRLTSGQGSLGRPSGQMSPGTLPAREPFIHLSHASDSVHLSDTLSRSQVDLGRLLLLCQLLAALASCWRRQTCFRTIFHFLITSIGGRIHSTLNPCL